MKVMVTGHCGRIGSRVAQQLIDRDVEVVGYDRAANPEHDLDDPYMLERQMDGCQVVVHCAGIPHPNKGTMPTYYVTNVTGTLHVLGSAVAAGLRRVVYASSTGYYGCDSKGDLDLGAVPWDRNRCPAMVLAGTSSELVLDAYNQSKVMAEALLAWYGTNRLIETVALRIAPANTKAEQYKPGLGWRDYTDWRRGCLFTNCHPDKAAEALILAALDEQEYWYWVYNVVDKYTHEDIDLQDFALANSAYIYPDWTQGESLIHPTALELGWQPCEDRR